MIRVFLLIGYPESLLLSAVVHVHHCILIHASKLPLLRKVHSVKLSCVIVINSR